MTAGDAARAPAPAADTGGCPEGIGPARRGSDQGTPVGVDAQLGRRARLTEALRDSRAPLLIYLAMSSITAVFLATGGWNQVELPGDDARFTGAFPLEVLDRYLGVVSNWDGRWYQRIATEGYPVPLPRAEDGTVVQNAWAFWPLYPALVRVVMSSTGVGFEPSAWVVSTFCGALAMVVLYRMAAPRMGRFGAGALVACFLAFPTAPILQVGYPEGLALLLVFWALWSLDRRQYGSVCLAAAGLALTRPIVLPLAAVVLVHGVRRWRAHLRSEADFSRGERLRVIGTVVTCTALFGLWPLLADLAVGERGVYLKTLSAWPVNQDSVGVIGGWFSDLIGFTPLGFLFAAIVLWTFYCVVRRGSERWPVEVRMWASVYVLYIFLATRPSSSIFRYLLLTVVLVLPFPEAVVVRGTRETGSKGAWIALSGVLAVGLVLQYLWVMGSLTIAAFPPQQPYP